MKNLRILRILRIWNKIQKKLLFPMKRNFRRKKNFIENFPIALQSRAGRGGRPPLATTTEDKGGEGGGAP